MAQQLDASLVDLLRVINNDREREVISHPRDYLRRRLYFLTTLLGFVNPKYVRALRCTRTPRSVVTKNSGPI